MKVSSRKVPRPKRRALLHAENAAIAIGAMIGMKRPNMMTKPPAMSHGTASGAGLGLLFRP